MNDLCCVLGFRAVVAVRFGFGLLLLGYFRGVHALSRFCIDLKSLLFVDDSFCFGSGGGSRHGLIWIGLWSATSSHLIDGALGGGTIKSW